MRDFYADAVADLDKEFPAVSLVEWQREKREGLATKWAWASLIFLVAAIALHSGVLLLFSVGAFVPFAINSEPSEGCGGY